jgi:hypothetical protein
VRTLKEVHVKADMLTTALYLHRLCLLVFPSLVQGYLSRFPAWSDLIFRGADLENRMVTQRKGGISRARSEPQLSRK